MKSTSENLEQAAVQQQCRSLRLPAVAEQCAPLADVATKQPCRSLAFGKSAVRQALYLTSEIARQRDPVCARF